MTALEPWYKVVFPREDLRQARPLDASEFAVHLDQVRRKEAPDVYSVPREFFDRTYLTQGLAGLAAEVVRRLAGIKVETSAAFNMSTQFGGGKTHALTLLYHLAEGGPEAKDWRGVQRILEQAGLRDVPQARTAVFVGTEFDSIAGRGGDDGTPKRQTPWGEIAFQLGGAGAFAVVAEHDRQFVEPKGDVIRAFLPKNQPCLILMDEIINYVSTYRRQGYHNSLYNFIQSLSETARGLDNVVLVVSTPASEMEYTDADASDQERFKKMLDRLGKAVMVSAEADASEIIRRRLFDWGGMPKEGRATAQAYADWVLANRYQIPQWFPIDHAVEEFEATYPFHPLAISVFERKWQSLPRFQRTRGILRLLALWVSRAYEQGYKGAHKDPLIGLGTAPLEDPLFRAAVFEQLGEERLEVAVTTDITGSSDAHAVRLDQEAAETIRQARVHRKVASVIFFESNGGMSREYATAPEARLDVAEPDLDIGNVETALEELSHTCYYLRVDGNRYRFGTTPNLNKVLADRRPNVDQALMKDRIRAEIQKAFGVVSGVERVFWAERSGDIPDHAALQVVIPAPDHNMADRNHTLAFADELTKAHGTSARTYKSGLVWALAEDESALKDAARDLLAWESIDEEKDSLRLDEEQRRQVMTSIRSAQRDLGEAVWRTYRHIGLLDRENQIKVVDCGLVHSSAADSLTRFVLNRLKLDGELTDTVSPSFLVRHWPPAFVEWSTRAVRDAFYASPQFPRLLDPEALKATIATGVSSGYLGYVGKTASGEYEPFQYKTTMEPWEVEISEDMYVITGETAEEYKKREADGDEDDGAGTGNGEHHLLTRLEISPASLILKPGEMARFTAQGIGQHGQPMSVSPQWTARGGTIDSNGSFVAGPSEGRFAVTVRADGHTAVASVDIKHVVPPRTMVSWTGEINAQKWMNYYMKVLAPFALSPGLELIVSFEVTEPNGIPDSKIADLKATLRELGLEDDVEVE